jgi:uncharacterized protein (TIGR04551 family)
MLEAGVMRLGLPSARVRWVSILTFGSVFAWCFSHAASAAAQSATAAAPPAGTDATDTRPRAADSSDLTAGSKGGSANDANGKGDGNASRSADKPAAPNRGGIDGSIGTAPKAVWSDDWWSHTRPTLELHGYLRTRGELFHNFSLGLGRVWPFPLDHSYADIESSQLKSLALCPNDPNGRCTDNSQAFGNMRFRLSPELHISDNLRVLAQIDALDNLILGSTPDSYANGGATNPLANSPINSTTQGPPTSGINSVRNSVDVKRAWAEYATPLGQVRFGRMPAHWGMGMLFNAGEGLDQDYQTTFDRIMVVSGIRSADVYFGASWDFQSTGPTTQSPYDVYGGQPYNTANRANVGQWWAFAAKRTNPDAQRAKLRKDEVVLNFGAMALTRTHELDYAAGQGPTTVGIDTVPNRGLVRRNGLTITPDLWMQLLWRKLRVEAEVAVTAGRLQERSSAAGDTLSKTVLSGGAVAQVEYLAAEDKLKLGFHAGWASGDSWDTTLGGTGALNLNRPGTLSTFRMSPAYNVDLILHRRLLRQVAGTYFIKPSVDYDFIRSAGGQKFGGGASIIYTRASEAIQAPGQSRDLGVEFNVQLYYQAKDGSLNDNPNKVGGFFAMLQYGALLPMAGLGLPPGTVSNPTNQKQLADAGVTGDTVTAQTLRLHLGVVF